MRYLSTVSVLAMGDVGQVWTFKEKRLQLRWAILSLHNF